MLNTVGKGFHTAGKILLYPFQAVGRAFRSCCGCFSAEKLDSKKEHIPAAQEKLKNRSQTNSAPLSTKKILCGAAIFGGTVAVITGLFGIFASANEKTPQQKSEDQKNENESEKPAVNKEKKADTKKSETDKTKAEKKEDATKELSSKGSTSLVKEDMIAGLNKVIVAAQDLPSAVQSHKPQQQTPAATIQPAETIQPQPAPKNLFPHKVAAPSSDAPIAAGKTVGKLGGNLLNLNFNPSMMSKGGYQTLRKQKTENFKDSAELQTAPLEKIEEAKPSMSDSFSTELKEFEVINIPQNKMTESAEGKKTEGKKKTEKEAVEEKNDSVKLYCPQKDRPTQTKRRPTRKKHRPSAKNVFNQAESNAQQPAVATAQPLTTSLNITPTAPAETEKKVPPPVPPKKLKTKQANVVAN